jgi:catechol 2,3-dioxygenase-like lactoylglutathione lyase family enzyme
VAEGTTVASSPFVRLDHPGYVVTDLEAASAFFVDVLGFEALPRKGVIADPDGEKMTGWFGVDPRAVHKFAFFKIGNDVVELMECDAPGKNTAPAKNSDTAGRHLSLFVTNLDDVRKLMANQPGVVIRDVTERGFFYISLPFGLEVQCTPLS